MNSPRRRPIASSPDGTHLAIAIRRQDMDIVNVDSGEAVASISLSQQVPCSMAYAKDGRRLAVGFAGGVKVYDTANCEILAEFTRPGSRSSRIALSPQGRLVAASPGSGCGDSAASPNRNRLGR